MTKLTDEAVYLVAKFVPQKVRSTDYLADFGQAGDILVERTPLNPAPIFEVCGLYFYAVYRDYGARVFERPGRLDVDAVGIIRTYNNPDATSVTTRRQATEGTSSVDTDDLFFSEKEDRYDAIAWHDHCALTYANARRQLAPLWRLKGYEVLCSSAPGAKPMVKTIYTKANIPINHRAWCFREFTPTREPAILPPDDKRFTTTDQGPSSPPPTAPTPAQTPSKYNVSVDDMAEALLQADQQARIAPRYDLGGIA
ncbi:hypothetical protein PENDEC_c003G00940 [Penicillium decumbens]|uniref:Uncharacterized protein n=1 Tax=Penicillium decumbens TaxID=69771 RepID=A0A1V6PJ31_PENDC|nr:hypothetical protein PENDEC_c003G00940 [Penicillium decumbens]